MKLKIKLDFKSIDFECNPNTKIFEIQQLILNHLRAEFMASLKENKNILVYEGIEYYVDHNPADFSYYQFFYKKTDEKPELLQLVFGTFPLASHITLGAYGLPENATLTCHGFLDLHRKAFGYVNVIEPDKTALLIQAAKEMYPRNYFVKFKIQIGPKSIDFECNTQDTKVIDIQKVVLNYLREDLLASLKKNGTVLVHEGIEYYADRRSADISNHKFYKKTAEQPEHLNLWFAEKELESTRTLSDSNISENAAIRFIPSFFGHKGRQTWGYTLEVTDPNERALLIQAAEKINPSSDSIGERAEAVTSAPTPTPTPVNQDPFDRTPSPSYESQSSSYWSFKMIMQVVLGFLGIIILLSALALIALAILAGPCGLACAGVAIKAIAHAGLLGMAAKATATVSAAIPPAIGEGVGGIATVGLGALTMYLIKNRWASTPEPQPAASIQVQNQG